MPNWCCGDLKIRGHIDDVKRCLDELIYEGGSVKKENGDIYLEDIQGHLKGTYRCFIDVPFNLKSYFGDFWSDKNDQIVVIIPVMHAWYPHSNEFKEISRKFNVDFRFYGYECGLGFNAEFEVIKGELTFEREIKFNDYRWECRNH